MPAPTDSLFAEVYGGAEERRSSAAYFFDNAARGGGRECVVQRTLRGRGFLEDAAGRHDVPAGCAMLFTHDEPTRYGYPADAREPYVLRYLAFDAGMLRPLFDGLRAAFGNVVRLPGDGEAAAHFDDLLRRYVRREFRDRFEQAELLHRFLVALHREQVRAEGSGDPVAVGYQHLRDHFRSPVRVKEVAARCGVTREHFARAFRARHGVSPAVFLRGLRCGLARVLQRGGRLTRAEVAAACGFSSPAALRRALRGRRTASAE